MNNYQYALDRLTRERVRVNAAIKFLRKHRKFIASLDKPISLCYDKLDFDNLTRPDVLRVLKAFPGKWVKDNYCGGGRLNYTLETEGIQVRIYAGEAPECCQIVEKVEYVTIPERIERRVTRELVCPEPKSAQPEEPASV